MLTWSCNRAARDCAGMSRRDFVTAGLLGLGGLSLPDLLWAKEEAGEKSYLRDKAVVLLFLGGGPSHIETFNPNLGAPAPYCSITGEAPTALSGLSLGGTFPLLAQHARKLAIVRSFTHPIGDHVKAIAHVLSGGTDPAGDLKAGYSMGSVFARLRGANHPASGLPTYALVTSPETDGQYRNERSRIESGSRPGSLGLPYSPFDPAGGGTLLKSLELRMPAERLDDRKQLLGQLDRIQRTLDGSGAMDGLDRFEKQALEMIVRGAGEAFDLRKEPKEIVARYDTSKFRVGKKVFQPSQLGRQMLMARRLVEAGCGFVTVQSSGWDMHADGNNPGVAAGMEMLGRPLDQAVSNFLSDLAARGLDDKVLLIITGDFGRTPRVNDRGGRDHWAKLCPLALAGGGLNMGQVIGQSSRQNDAPATDPLGPSNLLSTVLHTLFDVGRLRLDARAPRELVRLAEIASPIPGLS